MLYSASGNTPSASNLRVTGVHGRSQPMNSNDRPSGPGFFQLFNGPLMEGGPAWVQLRAITGTAAQLQRRDGDIDILLSFSDFVRIGWSYDRIRASLLAPTPRGAIPAPITFGFHGRLTSAADGSAVLDPLLVAVRHPQYFPAPALCPRGVDPYSTAPPRRRGGGGE